MITRVKSIFNQHFIIAIAMLAALIVYSRFLLFGHISWDDPEMVFQNKAVHGFDIKSLFTHHYVGNYIPVTMLFHSLGWAFFGDSDAGHHLLNILLHLTNGLLLYKLGNQVFKNNFVAGICSIIFLLHPVQVESVGWISELKNILSTTFYLATVMFYLKYQEDKKRKDYFLAFLLFILGCLSKPSVVILPMILILLDLFIIRKPVRKSLLDKIPFLTLSVAFGIINIKSQAADQFINYSHAFPYLQRVGMAGFALLKYLLLFIFPSGLSVIYPYPEIKNSVLIIGCVGLALIGGSIVYLGTRKKFDIIFLLLFILLNFVLVLQLLPFGEVLYADRYMYVPVIGFGWLLGLLFTRIKISKKMLCSVLIVIFSILTFSRAQAWKSAISLYEDILKKYPSQFVALNSAGVESMRLNEDERSLDYFNRAIKAAPRNYKSYYNRGLLYLKNGKPELAIKSLGQALELYDYHKAYVARASAYYMLNDIPHALKDAKHVLETEPNNAKAHFVLGNCYDSMNKLDEAMTEYNRCIELDADNHEYYFKRAIVFGKRQDFNSCKNDLSICIEINPDYYEAYYWRGVAKVNLNENPCEDLRIAARNNVSPAINAFNKYCR